MDTPKPKPKVKTPTKKVSKASTKTSTQSTNYGFGNLIPNSVAEPIVVPDTYGIKAEAPVETPVSLNTAYNNTRTPDVNLYSQTSPLPLEAPRWVAALGAGYQTTITAAMLRALDNGTVVPDKNFDPGSYIKITEANQGYSFSKEQVEVLMRSVSKEDFNNKWKELLNQEMVGRVSQESPAWTFVGGFLDPSLAAASGIAMKVVGAGASAMSIGSPRILSGATSAAVDFGASYTFTDASKEELAANVAISAVLGAMFPDMPNAPKLNLNKDVPGTGGATRNPLDGHRVTPEQAESAQVDAETAKMAKQAEDREAILRGDSAVTSTGQVLPTHVVQGVAETIPEAKVSTVPSWIQEQTAHIDTIFMPLEGNSPSGYARVLSTSSETMPEIKLVKASVVYDPSTTQKVPDKTKYTFMGLIGNTGKEHWVMFDADTVETPKYTYLGDTNAKQAWKYTPPSTEVQKPSISADAALAIKEALEVEVRVVSAKQKARDRAKERKAKQAAKKAQAKPSSSIRTEPEAETPIEKLPDSTESADLNTATISPDTPTALDTPTPTKEGADIENIDAEDVIDEEADVAAAEAEVRAGAESVPEDAIDLELPKATISPARPPVKNTAVRKVLGAFGRVGQSMFGEGTANAARRFKDTITNFQSLYDEVAKYNQDFADVFLGDFRKGSSRSATAISRNIELEQARLLVPLEQVLEKHGLAPKWRVGNRAAKAAQERNRVLADATLWLHRQHGAWLKDGTLIDMHPDPVVREIVQAYVDSGFAENYHKRITYAGTGVDAYVSRTAYSKLVAAKGVPQATMDIREAKRKAMEIGEDSKGSKYFVPIEFDMTKIRGLVEIQGAEKVAHALGMYVVRNSYRKPYVDTGRPYADLYNHTLNVGAAILKIMQGGAPGDNKLKAFIEERIAQDRAQVLQELQQVGLAPDVISHALGRGAEHAVSGFDSLAPTTRFDWDLDWDLGLSNSTGAPTRIQDLVKGDLYGTLNNYNIQTSARIGLAEMGFKSSRQLDDALDDMVERAVGAGQDRIEAQELMQYLRDLMLGNSVGDNTPSFWRNLASIAQASHLAASAIYNVPEYAIAMVDHGILETAGAAAKVLPEDSLKNLTKQEAETLYDMVSGRMVADGRLRPIVSKFEDNFDVGDSVFTESIQYGAQTVKYLNLAEFVRRHNIKTYVSLLYTQIKNGLDTGDNSFLTDMGMSNTEITQIQANIKEHGWNMDSWDLRTSDTLSAYALTAAENGVLAVRKGERPRMMDGNIGKIVFAYQTFVFGAHNKVLRRMYNRDGMAGVAKLIIYQAPLAILAGYAVNILGGKEYDDNWQSMTLKSMGALGLYGWLYGTVEQADRGGGNSTIAPLLSTASMVRETAFGNPPSIDRIIKNTPLLGITLPVRFLANNVLKPEE